MFNLRHGPKNKLRAILGASRPTKSTRGFTVLAVESSADDSCAAIVKSDRSILANVVLKGHKAHEKYGGIEPLTAIKFHQKYLPLAISQALSEANLSVNEVDGIAFTRGPGMGACLSVGYVAARTIATVTNKPFVGVHHMQAHALTPLLTTPDPPKFPFLTLLLSGGHTLLLIAYSPTSFRTLATTVDSSIGNAFDHLARMLSVSWMENSSPTSLDPPKYIGPGAAIEQLAKQDPVGATLPDIPAISMAFPRQLAFSYAGPVSHVQRFISKQPPERIAEDIPLRIAIARRFQEAAFGQVEDKVRLALKLCEKEGVDVTSLVVSGGVASNIYLRERLQTCLNEAGKDISLVFPPPHLCTDNAVMIGWAAMDRFLQKDHDTHDLDLRPTWALEDLLS